MFSNYVKTALRNIFRHKGYSFINVAGLALGMACCLFIMVWVIDELSYDRFHENAQHLYRVEQDQYYSGDIYHVTVTPYPMGPGLEAEIPEIKDAARYVWMGTRLLRYQEKAFFEDGIRAVDPSFLRMFTFPLIKGDAATALDGPHSLILSQEMAQKYFGDEDPLGKAVIINNTYSFSVTGVLKEIPSNSSYEFDMLIPFEFVRQSDWYSDSWNSNSITTLVQLHDQASVPDVNKKMTEIVTRHVAETIEDPERLRRFQEGPLTQFMLMPLTDIHLHSYFGYGKPMGDIQYVYIFTVIALFVLLIACINFMNLATARSANRAKEVGLRKVVGALKRHLVGQFFGESILLSFLALLFALIMVVSLLSRFNTLAGKELGLNVLFRWEFVAGMGGITLITGVISGSYPALFLSAFQPVKVLKGTLKAGMKSTVFRKVLVVTQFALSILLIVGTGIVYKQVSYMRSKKLGYDKEHMIYIPLRGNTPQSYPTFKEALLRNPLVVNVSGTGHSPTHIGSNSGGADWDGKDPELSVLIGQNRVDFDYIETMKIEMAEGRPFSKTFSTDTATAFLVNEEVVRIMGDESAVGKRFSFFGVDGTIVGVMKNFHFHPVRYEIEPLAFIVRPERIRYAVIRLAAGNIQEGLEFVQSTWEQVIPDYPFNYHFMDEDFDRMYRAESRMGSLLRAFAFLAIAIACLGLFGLASFTAEQRTKEIGVRKVLGASVPGIVFLFSKEFTKWVIAANAIALPVAYLVMRNWLQSYAYRTNLAWWVFFMSGAFALVVSLLTVSYQSVKAALANPSKSLRYE